MYDNGTLRKIKLTLVFTKNPSSRSDTEVRCVYCLTTVIVVLVILLVIGILDIHVLLV